MTACSSWSRSTARRGAEIEGTSLATELSRRGLVTTAVALSPSDASSPLELEVLGPIAVRSRDVAGAAPAGEGGGRRRRLRLEDAAGLCARARRQQHALRLSEHRRSVGVGGRAAAPPANGRRAPPRPPRGGAVDPCRARDPQRCTGSLRPRSRSRPTLATTARYVPATEAQREHARATLGVEPRPAGRVAHRRADQREATRPRRRGGRRALRRRPPRRRGRAVPDRCRERGAPLRWRLPRARRGARRPSRAARLRRRRLDELDRRHAGITHRGCAQRRAGRRDGRRVRVRRRRAGRRARPSRCRPRDVATAVRTALDDAARSRTARPATRRGAPLLERRRAHLVGRARGRVTGPRLSAPRYR